MKDVLNRLIDGKNLEEEESMDIMETIMEGELTPAQIGGFITALRIKGEVVSEITGCARAMRNKAVSVSVNGFDCIDTCGTGGDGANIYNVSTASAFILASAGVPVAKHGNRSISSSCGSADVLEALGVRIDLSAEAVERSIKDVGIGFMFAPIYHSAMKHAIGPRRELGIRTIFNILGPLTNPAKASFHILGVYDPKLTSTMAQVLKNLGVKRAMVVHGMDGLDEISISAFTKVSELKNNGEIIDYYINPRDVGINYSTNNQLRGGDKEVNSRIILNLLKGEKGPKRDMLLLNSGAALYISGKTESIKEGTILAKELIDNGEALRTLEKFRRVTREYVQ